MNVGNALTQTRGRLLSPFILTDTLERMTILAPLCIIEYLFYILIKFERKVVKPNKIVCANFMVVVYINFMFSYFLSFAKY